MSVKEMRANFAMFKGIEKAQWMWLRQINKITKKNHQIGFFSFSISPLSFDLNQHGSGVVSRLESCHARRLSRNLNNREPRKIFPKSRQAKKEEEKTPKANTTRKTSPLKALSPSKRKVSSCLRQSIQSPQSQRRRYLPEDQVDSRKSVQYSL